MEPSLLAERLGFPNGVPLLFNKYRHRDGLITPWDTHVTHLFEPKAARNNEDMIPFVPHWHQLAGTHAVLRKVFNSERDQDACTGMLVADDVGLGKTCQATLIVSALADAVQLRKEKKDLPPLLGALLSTTFCP